MSKARIDIGPETKGPDQTIALNPMVGVNPEDLLRAAGLVATEMVRQPTIFAKHVGAFAKDMADVMIGKSKIAPDPRDKRFNAPFWSENGVYKRGMQGWHAFKHNLKSGPTTSTSTSRTRRASTSSWTSSPTRSRRRTRCSATRWL